MMSKYVQVASKDAKATVHHLQQSCRLLGGIFSLQVLPQGSHVCCETFSSAEYSECVASCCAAGIGRKTTRKTTRLLLQPSKKD